MTAFALREARIDPRPGKLIEQLELTKESTSGQPESEADLRPRACVSRYDPSPVRPDFWDGGGATHVDSCHLPLLIKKLGR